MSRNSRSFARSLLLGASLTLAGTSLAFADDSSMSMYTGDSYAYFNHLDYSLGKFNVARTAGSEQPEAVVKSPASPRTERRIQLAARPAQSGRTTPFSDDKGA